MFTLMIVGFHSSMFWTEEMGEPFFHGGYIAVDFFFLVSGCLMARSMWHNQAEAKSVGKECVRFIGHKIMGFYPYYFFGWVVSFATTQILDQASLATMTSQFVLSIYNLLMLEMARNFGMGHYLGASWYISAMLLAIFILYPLRRKWTDFFDYMIAPLLGIFMLGYVYQFAGNMCLVILFDLKLFVYDGMVRAISEVALGCLCFRLGERLKDLQFTVLGRILVSVLENAGYIFVFVSAYQQGYTTLDLSLVLILGCCIILSFSQAGILSDLFHNQGCSFLGSISLSLYVTHILIAEKIMPRILGADISLGGALHLYFGLVLLAGLVFHFFVKGLMKVLNRMAPKLKCAIIKGL